MANPSEITTSVGLSRSEERAILWVTCLAAFLFFNSFGSIGVALPAIQAQFGNSLSELQWVNLMGVVTISSLSFCFGRAGGIFGQRRLYKIGVVFYAAGAGVAAISISFRHLLLARAIMAVGLAMALPTSTAILAANYDAHRRGRVLGLFASAIAVGRMTGPTVGGILLQFGSWQWIFAMNFILGFIVSAAVFKIFPGSGERCYERFDIWGALALLVGYPALLVGLTFGAQFGWTSTGILALFVLAVIALELCQGRARNRKTAHRHCDLQTKSAVDISGDSSFGANHSLSNRSLRAALHSKRARCVGTGRRNLIGRFAAFHRGVFAIQRVACRSF
ncbi:MAG TPA: MFS transporter [Candidatus Binatia bacterium]|nr:MFS transporter [Candidatus Binatia bacterium]